MIVGSPQGPGRCLTFVPSRVQADDEGPQVGILPQQLPQPTGILGGLVVRTLSTLYQIEQQAHLGVVERTSAIRFRIDLSGRRRIPAVVAAQMVMDPHQPGP